MAVDWSQFKPVQQEVDWSQFKPVDQPTPVATLPPGSPTMQATEPPGVLEQLGNAFMTLIGGDGIDRPLVARMDEAQSQAASALIPDAIERGLSRFKQGAVIGGELFGAGTTDANAVALGQLSRDIDRRAMPADRQATLQAITESDGVMGLGATLLGNPMDSAAAVGDVALESLGLMAPTMALSGLGSLAGPAGTAVTAGASSFGTEFTQTIAQRIQERGGDPTDPGMWAAALKDDALMADAKESGLARGIPIAAFDALSAGLAGRFLRLADGVGETVRQSGKELLTQSALGGAGEAVAGLVDESKVNIGDVFLEAVAEGPTSVAEVAGNAAGARSRDRAEAAQLETAALRQALGALDPNMRQPEPAPVPAPQAAPAPVVTGSAEAEAEAEAEDETIAPEPTADLTAALSNLPPEAGEALGAIMANPEAMGAVLDILNAPTGPDVDGEAQALAAALGAAMQQPAAPEALGDLMQPEQTPVRAAPETPSAPVPAPLPQETTPGQAAPVAGHSPDPEGVQKAAARQENAGIPKLQNPDISADILAAPRKQYIAEKAKAAKIKKGSPGYDQAVKRIEDDYDAELDRAEASLPFDQFQVRKASNPESVNRKAWEALREDYGIGKSEAVQTVAAEAKKATKGMKNAPKVKVVETQADLPPKIIDAIKQSAEQGKTEGLYDPRSGEVYLIADAITSPGRVRWVVAHEVSGHVGLRGAAKQAGRDLDTDLTEAQSNPFVAELAERLAAERNTEGLVSVEEALAELSAATNENAWQEIESRYGVRVPRGMRSGVRAAVDRFIQAVKRAIFGGDGMSDSDVRKLIRDAGRYVREGAAAEASGDTVRMSTRENEDYAGEHAAPMSDSGAPAHDLTGGGNYYPDDVYSAQGLQYYGTGDDIFDREAFSIVRALRGKPNATVRIYRAVPKIQTNAEKLADVQKEMAQIMRRGGSSARYDWLYDERARLAALPDDPAPKIEINAGDWVSIVRGYAKDHGEGALNGSYRIITKTVKASEIFTNGDSIQEWGYDPQAKAKARTPRQSTAPNPSESPNGSFSDPASPSIVRSTMRPYNAKPQTPAGDGSKGGGMPSAKPKLKPRTRNDLRQFDHVPPRAKKGVVQQAMDELKAEVDGLRALMKGRPKNPKTIAQGLNSVRSRIFDSAQSRARALEARNPKSKALRDLFNLVMAAPGDSRLVLETLADATASRFAIFTNRARNVLESYGLGKMTPAENNQLRQAMLGTATEPDANIAAAAKSLRALMDRMHEDMIAAGVDVGIVEDIGYLTRMYDEAVIMDDEAGFIEAATKLFHDHEFALEVGIDTRGMVYEPQRLAVFLSHARRSQDPDVIRALDAVKKRLESYRYGGNFRDVLAVERILEDVYETVRAEYADRRAAGWLHRIKTPNLQEYGNGLTPSAAPLTKQRTLSAAADKIMAPYMKTDMLDILDTFARKASEKTEHALRFGPKGERAQELIDRASREGVPKHDLDEASRLLSATVGVSGKIDGTMKSALDALHTWTYLALLSKAAISSLAEGVTFAMRTGDLRQVAAPLAMAMHAVARSKRRAELQRLALAMGVNGNRAVEDVIINRLGGDHAMTPKWSRLLTKFFRSIGLAGLTEAQRAYGVGVATGFLRKMSQQAVGKNPGDAPALLNELGIADHKAFAEWMAEQGGLPSPDELFDENGRPTMMGNDYMVAVRRFVDQTIQKPGREHRPVWASTEAGRLVTGIMSFSYAQYANVTKRQITMMRRRGLSRQDALWLGGALGLVVAQSIVSVLREALFNADRFEDKEKDEIFWEMLMLGYTRSFGYGSGDPLIQYMTGLKYQRSMAETAVGAGPGLLFQGIDKVSQLATDRNSESTDTSEYRAAQSLYRMLAVPAINLLLSRIPYGGVGIIELSDKEYANDFAGQFARKPEARSQINDLYAEAKAELDDLREQIDSRIGELPRDQWASELEVLRAEYPGLLGDVQLDTYADNTQNRNKGVAGLPKGRTPQIKTGEGDEPSLIGELEGYSKWRMVGGKPKQMTEGGLQNKITELNKQIGALARDPGAVTYAKLVTFGAGSAASDALAERIKANPKLGKVEASKSEVNDVLDELYAARRALKREAVDLVNKGLAGEKIERRSPS